MTNNIIPDKVKKIHMIAICGTGMGALAGMLKSLGLNVTGSDDKVYPPMSTFLTEKGIEILKGFSEKNLADRPDLVIVGNAVSKGNPEAVEMIEKNIPFCSMPQAVQHFFGSRGKVALIAGTHGKTTTSSLLAWTLMTARQDPSFFIGGIVKDFNSNSKVGNGEFLVVEGDEYDTAFFDKGPKFLHYSPSHTILTSVEFDHADIYRDLAHVREAFDKLLSKMSENSFLSACIADDQVRSLILNRKFRINTYGHETADWNLGKVQIDPPWTQFEVFYKKELFSTFRTKLMGHHNLMNALAVISVANDINITKNDISEALKTFQGVKRRQEIRGVVNGIAVMDDFAHHPTAVRETLKAVHPFYKQGRIIAVFEPRTNSSRRKVFQDIYPSAFELADMICIPKPPLLEKIPVNERFSSEQLVQDLNKLGKKAYYFDTTEQIIEFVKQNAKPNDLVMVMSNGGFDNIHERLLKSLEN